ncbi:MAG TPA: ATP-binding protein [Chloroflexota bacterium]
MRRVRRAFKEPLDLVDLCRVLYRAAKPLIDATGFYLAIYDPGSQTVEVVRQIDSGKELPGGTFPLGDGFTSRVIRTGEPLLVHAWSAERPPIAIQYATGQPGLPESGITVPILRTLPGPPLGVLTAQSYQRAAYDESDLAFLTALAAEAARCLENRERARREAAQTIRKSQELEGILASIQDALIVTDASGSITRFNAAARDLFGPTTSIVVGQPLGQQQWGLWPLGTQGLAEAFGPLIDDLRQGRARKDVEVQIQTHGGPRTVSVNLSPIRDTDGLITGGIFLIHDVTARRALERLKDNLLTSQNVASSLLETCLPTVGARAGVLALAPTDGGPLVQVDATGYVEASPAARGRVRVAMDSALSEAVRDGSVVVRPARDHVAIGCDGPKQSHGICAYDSAVGVPLLIGDRAIGGLGLVFDTHRPFVESDAALLLAIGREAAQALLRETLHAAEQTARAAMEAAEATSRLKSEFLANMSHELRTPLNGIIGFSELLHDERIGPLEPRQKTYTGHILTSSRHLLQLVNDVLDLSKIEAGELGCAPVLIDPKPLAQEVADNLQSVAEARRVTVAIEVDPHLGAIVTDGLRFKQIVYNYLSNALKFSPDGSRVRLRILPEGDRAFRITVEDSGVGIRPEDMSKLFTPFQQLDAGAAKKYQGTGLGLALTKRIVEAQGGRVEVQSTVGQGSVFSVILPTGTAQDRGRRPLEQP